MAQNVLSDNILLMYDEAVLRCFDIAINLPIPDEKIRKRIIEKYSNGLSTKESVKRLFGYASLTGRHIKGSQSGVKFR